MLLGHANGSFGFESMGDEIDDTDILKRDDRV